MPVYIIAEVGVNHNGSLETAKQLIDAAKAAGCNCVKFQVFKTDELVTEYAEKAQYQKHNTKNAQESQYKMLKKLELKDSDFVLIKKYCEKIEIDFLATPFDINSVDLLENLHVCQYKVSSGDLTNKPLLQYIAQKKKRILLSTGMASLDEVKQAVTWINEMDWNDIVLFHCTSDYPAPYETVNMNAMLTLKNTFKLPIGYSDHTTGIEIALMAVSMGASVIEKHFTLNKDMNGPDHRASLEPAELEHLVHSIRNIEKAFGSGEKEPTDSELLTRNIARKSLVYAKNMKKGAVVTPPDLKCKRPGTGISPALINEIIYKTLLHDCKKDALVEWKDLN